MSLFLAQPYHLGLDRLSLNSIDDQRAAIGAISNTDLVNALAAYTPTTSLAPVALSGSASHLTTGTLADARLSSNVPLKNAANNVFTGAMTVGGIGTFSSLDTGYNVIEGGYYNARGTNYTGYYEWRKTTGRQGYMGCDSGTDITLTNEVGGAFSVVATGIKVGFGGPFLKNSSGALQVRNSADSAFATAEMDQGRVHTRLRVGTLPASSYPLEVNGYGQAYESTAIATGWLSRNSLSQWGAQVSTGGDWEVMQYIPSVFRRLWVTQAGEVYTQNQQTTASATTGNSLTIRAIASQTGRLLRFANVSNAEIGFVGVDGSASFNGNLVVGTGATYGASAAGRVTASQLYINPTGVKALYSYADSVYAGWINNSTSVGEYYYFGNGGHYFGNNGANQLTLSTTAATFSGTVQVGGASGNLLKNVTGGIQARNSADSAYVRLEANGVTNQVGNLLLQAGPTWNDGSQIIFQNGPTVMATMQASGLSINIPMTYPVNTWINDSAGNARIQFIGSGATAIRGHGTNLVDFLQSGGSAIGRFTTSGFFSFGNISASGSYFLTGGSGPQMYETTGRFTFRNNANNDFAGFISNEALITSSLGGSVATPSVAGVHLKSALNAYSVGGLFGKSYTSNLSYGDIFLWANPAVTTLDYSNRTEDLAIRGNTGNVEINRGRLVLADVALSQSWGLKTQFGAVSGQLDFINHTGSTRLSLYQDGRMWITGAVAAGTFSGLNITNITANAAGVKTQIRLPVFNSSEGGVIEEFGNSFDGYRLNISQAQGGPITFTTGGIESMRIDGANRITFGVGTAYGKVNIYDGAAYIIQDQPVIWHSAGTIRSQIIGDSTNNLRFSTRVGGVLTENMVIASTGQVTVSQGLLQIGTSTGPILRTNSNGLDVRNSGNTDWGQLNVKEIRGDGLSYSRFAQMATAGSWGGGYNFNLNGGVANRDSTGTVAAVWYTTTGINWYAEPSAVAGAISPRLTLNSTLLSMNGSIQAQSASDTTKGLLCRNSGATGNALGQMMIGHPGWYDNQLLLMHDSTVVANMSSTFFIVQKAAQLLAGAAVTGQVSITGSNSISSGVLMSNTASTLGRTSRMLIGWPGNYDDQLLMYHGSTLFANVSDATVNFTRTIGVQNQSGTTTRIVNTNNGNNAIDWNSTGAPGTRITALTDMRLAIDYVDRVTLTNTLFSVIPNATFGGTVQVGGASGHLLKRSVDELQIRDSTDAAWRDIQARVARFNSAGGQTLVINGTDIAGGGSYMYLTSGSTHLYLRTNAAANQPLTLINSSCIFAPNVWHGDSVNLSRFFYVGNGSTYYKGFGLVPHEWRNAAESFIMRLGDTGALEVLSYIDSAFRTMAADPSTIDIAAGKHQLVKNTTSGEIRDWVNDGGTMKKGPAYV